jgi:hypothetical protein
MIYLSRKPNLVFAPPQAALDAASQRQAAEIQAFEEAETQRAQADSLRAAGVVPGTVDGDGVPVEEGVAEETLTPEEIEKNRIEAEKKAEEEAKKKAKKEEEERKKKEREKNWDMLR